MKLECKIRRPGGSEVTMPNGEGEPDTTYHFKPIDPTRADSPHVCEVDNDNHLSRFIAAAPETYVIFREGKAPTLQAPKAPEAPPAPPAPDTSDQAGDGDADGDDDGSEGQLTVAELAEGIAAGKFSQEELREMLAAEEESGKPRKGFVKAITHALK